MSAWTLRVVNMETGKDEIPVELFPAQGKAYSVLMSTALQISLKQKMKVGQRRWGHMDFGQKIQSIQTGIPFSIDIDYESHPTLDFRIDKAEGVYYYFPREENSPDAGPFPAKINETVLIPLDALMYWNNLYQMNYGRIPPAARRWIEASGVLYAKSKMHPEAALDALARSMDAHGLDLSVYGTPLPTKL